MTLKRTEYRRWYRGAVRWDNGSTMYGKKYLLRIIMNWAKDKKRGKRISVEDVKSALQALQQQSEI